MPLDTAHHVVIIGGGFGGLNVARSLKSSKVRVTLIDRCNYHLFQPLLYQVATGGLSPANIAAPLRAVLKNQKNTGVLLDEVTDIDPLKRRVILESGPLRYQTLVIATGVRHCYFGHGEWPPQAPGLKTVDDATEIRGRILSAFESAEGETDEAAVARWLTFCVVGAGPTGVELAGAIGELGQHTLKRDYRHIDSSKARVVLLEGLDRVLPSYPPELSAKAQLELSRLGVTVRTSSQVTAIRPDSVTIRTGKVAEEIQCRTVLWAAGVEASPLGAMLASAIDVETDRMGRLIVGSHCSLPGHPEIFVIGDLAHFHHKLEQSLPGVAPVAIQQGRYVATVIKNRLSGKRTEPFRYKDRGSMATIGRAAAVADIGPLHFGGFLAWLAWLFVHLILLIGFENRLLVLTQWAWNYITRNRSARLITGPNAARSTPRTDSESANH